MIFVSKSFSLSTSVGYLDLLEAVQERAAFERPSMCLLSVSVGRIVSPPSCNRFIFSFPAIFGSIHGFPTIALPLFRSMAFSCSFSLDCVQRICKDVDSSFDFICVFLRGFQTLTASAVISSLFGMLQAWRTLSCSDCFAKFVQLDVGHLSSL